MQGCSKEGAGCGIGKGGGWNIGGALNEEATAGQHRGGDCEFARAVLDNLSAKHGVDTCDVIFFGNSNGAALIHDCFVAWDA